MVLFQMVNAQTRNALSSGKCSSAQNVRCQMVKWSKWSNAKCSLAQMYKDAYTQESVMHKCTSAYEHLYIQMLICTSAHVQNGQLVTMPTAHTTNAHVHKCTSAYVCGQMHKCTNAKCGQMYKNAQMHMSKMVNKQVTMPNAPNKCTLTYRW